MKQCKECGVTVRGLGQCACFDSAPLHCGPVGARGFVAPSAKLPERPKRHRFSSPRPRPPPDIQLTEKTDLAKVGKDLAEIEAVLALLSPRATNRVRDFNIVMERVHGATFDAIGAKHGIGGNRARSICLTSSRRGRQDIERSLREWIARSRKLDALRCLVQEIEQHTLVFEPLAPMWCL